MNRYIFIGIILIVAAVIRMIRIELGKFRVVNYSIPMWNEAVHMTKGKKLKKVCRFVFLADLHNHSYGTDNERLLAAIDEAEPDFIVSAGDMLIAKPGRSMDVPIKLLKALSEKYPIYYGNGNHEYRLRIYPKTYGDMYKRYKEALDSLGIHHLENADQTIECSGKKINITGLEINRRFYKRFHRPQMDTQYLTSELGRKKNIFTILIAHNPTYFPQYAEWGAELTLSGHVHGGVVRIPGLGGVLSPDLRLFPKYDGGLYKSDGKYMILSRGLGMHTIPVRIFNRAELIVVDLVDAE